VISIRVFFLFIRQGLHLSNKLYTDRSNKLSIRAPKHRIVSYTMINHLVRKRNENNERDEKETMDRILRFKFTFQ